MAVAPDFPELTFAAAVSAVADWLTTSKCILPKPADPPCARTEPQRAFSSLASQLCEAATLPEPITGRTNKARSITASFVEACWLLPSNPPATCVAAPPMTLFGRLIEWYVAVTDAAEFRRIALERCRLRVFAAAPDASGDATAPAPARLYMCVGLAFPDSDEPWGPAVRAAWAAAGVEDEGPCDLLCGLRCVAAAEHGGDAELLVLPSALLWPWIVAPSCA